MTNNIPSGILCSGDMKIGNRENIILLSIKLFSSKGYDSVGIQEIVDTAGITKPTLYHYFGSKKGLLDEIIKLYGEKLINIIQKESFYQKDIVKNLNNITLKFIKFALENNAFYRMQLAMYFSPPENEAHKAVIEMNQKIFNLIENLFENASLDHGNMKGRQKIYAVTFIGMINNYIGLIMNNYLDMNDDLIYKAVHQFMHGIFS